MFESCYPSKWSRAALRAASTTLTGNTPKGSNGDAKHRKIVPKALRRYQKCIGGPKINPKVSKGTPRETKGGPMEPKGPQGDSKEDPEGDKRRLKGPWDAQGDPGDTKKHPKDTHDIPKATHGSPKGMKKSQYYENI